MMAKKKETYKTLWAAARPKVKTGKGLTKQSFKRECDINHILARYDKEGVISHLNKAKAIYADCTALPQDYRAALHRVRAAEELFYQLPSEVREEFENDPALFLDEVGQAEPERLKELGIMQEQAARESLEDTRAAKAAEAAESISKLHEKVDAILGTPAGSEVPQNASEEA